MGEGYRQTVTAATIAAYELGLGDLPIVAIEQAVKRALRTSKFMPTPAELRELAGEAKPEDRAVLAWSAFERAVLQHGGYASVCFDDAVINATVRSLGGWQRCCGLPPEEFDKWLRKDFLQAYSAFCRAGVGPDAAAPLVGIHDQQNALTHPTHVKAVMLVKTGLPPLQGTPRIEREPVALLALAASIGKIERW
jgi:hypothetical protein